MSSGKPTLEWKQQEDRTTWQAETARAWLEITDCNHGRWALKAFVPEEQRRVNSLMHQFAKGFCSASNPTDAMIECERLARSSIVNLFGKLLP